jgi:hypothetical protein
MRPSWLKIQWHTNEEEGVSPNSVLEVTPWPIGHKNARDYKRRKELRGMW